MNVNVEKTLLVLVVASLALTSINVLVRAENPITREEAIEISRNSELVQSLLENADRYWLEIHYQNKTQSGRDHGIWYVSWYIHPIDAPSAAGYGVTHDIDEETGEILYEGTASAR